LAGGSIVSTFAPLRVRWRRHRRGNRTVRPIAHGDKFERSVVSGGAQLAQQRRVEAARCEPPPFERALDEVIRLGRNNHRYFRHFVEPADLAVGPEAAPARLQLFETRRGTIGQPGWSVGNDDVRGGAHHFDDPLLRRHASIQRPGP
jgi:hypothetical protein